MVIYIVVTWKLSLRSSWLVKCIWNRWFNTSFTSVQSVLIGWINSGQGHYSKVKVRGFQLDAGMNSDTLKNVTFDYSTCLFGTAVSAYENAIFHISDWKSAGRSLGQCIEKQSSRLFWNEYAWIDFSGEQPCLIIWHRSSCVAPPGVHSLGVKVIFFFDVYLSPAIDDSRIQCFTICRTIHRSRYPTGQYPTGQYPTSEPLSKRICA